MYSISRGASRQFTASVTARAIAAPNSTAKNSGPFLSSTATRSWGPTPSVARPCATRAASSRSSR